MQVNAISSYDKGFTGKRDNIDSAIAQDDRYVRAYAYQKAMHDVKDKKHQKISNALWYAIPAAAGLSRALLTRGSISLFGKGIDGLASKLTAGIVGALPWAIGFGIVDGISKANNAISKKSEDFREAKAKHPIISFAGLIGTCMAAFAAAEFTICKAFDKMGPKTYARLGNAAEKFAKVINKVKTPEFIKKPVSKLIAGAPKLIKNGAKFGISVAPQALLLTALLHSISHRIDRRNEFEKNYTAMKDTQLRLAQARVNELKLQNDFLMQTPENKEDLEIVKEPLKDMPEEVIDKIDDLKANAPQEEIVLKKTETEAPVDKDVEFTETENADEISSDDNADNED